MLLVNFQDYIIKMSVSIPMSKAKLLFKAKPKRPCYQQIALKQQIRCTQQSRQSIKTQQTKQILTKLNFQLNTQNNKQSLIQEIDQIVENTDLNGNKDNSQKLFQIILKKSQKFSTLKLKITDSQPLKNIISQAKVQPIQLNQLVVKKQVFRYKIYNPNNFKQLPQTKSSIHRWEFGNGQTPSYLMISSWNVNGIRARLNMNQIQPYVESVKPDIFCINEHKMDIKSYDNLHFKFYGYYEYWNFPKHSLGYSGVAIFSKYPAKSMIQDLPNPQHSKQGRLITLQFQKFVLVNCYIPTCGRELQRLKYRCDQYDVAFRQYIITLKAKYPDKAIIICGDLNVAHHQIDCHTGKRMKQGKQPAFTIKQRNNFTSLLKHAQLIDTFRYLYPQKRAYTWWNMRRGGRKRAGQTGIGKRLDYFLISKQHLKTLQSSQIKKEWQGCDHCPIELKINLI